MAKLAKDMTRRELVAKVQTAFAASELFSPAMVAKFGEHVWRYMHTDLLRVLCWLRFELIGFPLVCNTKTLTQRGFRENTCDIVSSKTAAGTLYVSAHSLGMGVDLSCPSMSAEDMRSKIKANAKDAPCNVRIERGVNWLHIDVIDTGVNVYEFTA